MCNALSWYDMIWWLYMTPVYGRVGGRLSLRSKGDLLAPSLIMLNTHTHTHTYIHTHTHTHTLPFYFFLFVIFLFLSRFFYLLWSYQSSVSTFIVLFIPIFYLIALFMKLLSPLIEKQLQKHFRVCLFSTYSQTLL